jgi:hypothetical protein
MIAIIRKSIFAFILSLFVCPLFAQDIQVNASVSTDVLGVQDQLQFTITVSGKDAGDVEPPRLAKIKGFQIVGGPSVSSQFQWINGRSSSSKSFGWILLSEQEGQFTIDPVEVRAGNRVFKTQPLTIKVSGSASPAPRRQTSPYFPFERESQPERSQAGVDEIFVTSELDRSSVYPGQQVTLSYLLYTRVGVSGIQIQENPSLNGFWVEDLEVPRNPAGIRKSISGREYMAYLIKKQALFPNAAGKARIPAATFAVSARTASDLFGVFAQNETLLRKTKEISLDVKALPEKGRPAGFANAVGSFNLSSNLDKSEVSAGDAVTLRVKLSGRGNLKTVPDIALPVMPDFTVYSSKRTDNIRPSEEDSIGGEKVWEYVIVPKAPGQQVIPALSIAYFDPQGEKYETATAPALNLKVNPGAGGGGGGGPILSGLTKQNLTRQGSDINFIKLNPGDLDPAGERIYASAWFYLLAVIPVVFNIAVFFYQREKTRQASDFVFTRRRRARRMSFARIREAQKAGRIEPRRFYDEAGSALGGYLCARFNLPEIAVTGDSLERNLAEKSVSENLVREILECLKECDFGRFVSASASPDKMSSLAARIRKIIDDLENV